MRDTLSAIANTATAADFDDIVLFHAYGICSKYSSHIFISRKMLEKQRGSVRRKKKVAQRESSVFFFTKYVFLH
jgi:hypothetical protein